MKFLTKTLTVVGLFWFLLASQAAFSLNEDTCQEYAIGEVRLGTDRGLNKMKWFEGTRNYAVKRMSFNTYSLFFNLAFTSDKSDIEKDQEEHSMQEKAQECFNWFNNKFEGDGLTKLLLNIWQGSSGIAEPRSVKIAIGYTSAETSRKYNSTISCPVLIHEVLHLTGLVDEYHDNLYSCRSTATSIMGDNRTQFDSSGKVLKFEKPGEIVCGCREGLDDYDATTCAQGLEKYYRQAQLSPAEACPADTIELNRSKLSVEYSVDRTGKGHNIITDGTYRAVYIVRLNTSKLVPVFALRPAHIRAILFPECLSKNRVYLSCSKNAYENKNCYITEPLCRTDDLWLE